MRYLPYITIFSTANLAIFIFTAALINLRYICVCIWATLTLTICAVSAISTGMAFTNMHSLRDFDLRMLNGYFKKLRSGYF